MAGILALVTIQTRVKESVHCEQSPGSDGTFFYRSV